MAKKYYSEDHEYIIVNGDIGTIGISEYAQNALGDVVYVELPEVGDEIEQSESVGVVESVKSASEIYAPVSGEVLEINEDVSSNAALINEDAEGDGWLYKIKISDMSELEGLKDEGSYQEYIQGL